MQLQLKDKIDGEEELEIELPSISPSTIQTIPQRCAICNGFAYSKHFRVISCRAWQVFSYKVK
jgi:hypothetical protein